MLDDDSARIGGEFRPQRFPERHRFGRDHMHQWAALQTRKDGGIDAPRDIGIVTEDHAAARAPQCLVRRRRDDMRVRDRARMRLPGDKPRKMRHIDHQIGAGAVGNRAEASEIDDARIGAAAGDDQPRPMLLGLALDLVEIDARIRGAHAVTNGVEPFARQIRRRAMRQMTSGRQRHAEDRVAGLQQREEDRLIRLGAGMRLHIRETTAEQLLGALDREAFGDIDEIAATVIAASRIALGVFVRERRTLRFEHRLRDDVLAGDELNLRLFALDFTIDRRGQLRIGGSKIVGEKTDGAFSQ